MKTWLLLLLAPYAMGALKDLTKVCRDTGSVRTLLSSPAPLELYRVAVRAYFGEAATRCETFERIVADLRELLHDRSDFSEQAAARPFLPLEVDLDEFKVQPLSRALEGVWLPVADCKRRCVESEMSSHERWSSLLRGSTSFVVEKAGKFQGAGIRLTSVRLLGREYGYATRIGEFWNTRDGHRVWQHWSERALANLPPSWAGIVEAKDPKTSDSTLGALPSGASVESVADASTAGFIGQMMGRRCIGEPVRGNIDLLNAEAESPTGVQNLGVEVTLSLNVQGLDALIQSANYPGRSGLLNAVPAGKRKTVETELIARIRSRSGEESDRARSILTLNALNQTLNQYAGVRSLTINTTVRAPTSASSSADDLSITEFKRALSDPSPLVRTAAGLSLVSHRYLSDEVGTVLRDLAKPSVRDSVFERGGHGMRRTPFASHETEVRTDAVDGLLDAGVPVPPKMYSELVESAAKEKNSRTQERAAEAIREAYFLGGPTILQAAIEIRRGAGAYQEHILKVSSCDEIKRARQDSQEQQEKTSALLLGPRVASLDGGMHNDRSFDHIAPGRPTLSFERQARELTGDFRCSPLADRDEMNCRAVRGTKGSLFFRGTIRCQGTICDVQKGQWIQIDETGAEKPIPKDRTLVVTGGALGSLDPDLSDDQYVFTPFGWQPAPCNCQSKCSGIPFGNGVE